MTRRYKTKRHTSPMLSGLWLVYDSEHSEYLPLLIKMSRRYVAKVAVRMNAYGGNFYTGGQTQQERDLWLARQYYQYERFFGSPPAGTSGEAHAEAIKRVTKEEALRPRRMLDLGLVAGFVER